MHGEEDGCGVLNMQRNMQMQKKIRLSPPNHYKTKLTTLYTNTKAFSPKIKINNN